MTEKEYIEREKLNDMLEDFCVNESFYDALQTIPSADVAPVRHGHWKEEEGWSPDDYYYTCSVCGEDYVTIDGRTPDYNFCPHCGAKMDEEESENDR